MKKFLSVMLAVMMVLSTVSFAAPSLVGTADTALEAPAVEVPAVEEETAVLAAEISDDVNGYGELIFELNFDNLSSISSQTITFTDAGFINPAAEQFNNLSSSATMTFTAWPTYAIKERATGDNYLELAGGTGYAVALLNSNTNYGFQTKDGVYTLTADVYRPDAMPFTTRFSGGSSEDTPIQDFSALNDAGWGSIILQHDETCFGNGGHATPFDSINDVRTIKFHRNGGTDAKTVGYDNIRLYYKPLTAKVTLVSDAYYLTLPEAFDVSTTGIVVSELVKDVEKAAVYCEITGVKVNGKEYGLTDTVVIAKDCEVEVLSNEDTEYVAEWVDKRYGTLLFKSDFDSAAVGSIDLMGDDNADLAAFQATSEMNPYFSEYSSMSSGAMLLGSNGLSSAEIVADSTLGGNVLKITTEGASYPQIAYVTPYNQRAVCDIVNSTTGVLTIVHKYKTTTGINPTYRYNGWKNDGTMTGNGGDVAQTSQTSKDLGNGYTEWVATYNMVETYHIDNFKLHVNSGTVTGDTYFDDIKLYWKPATVNVEIADCDVKGVKVTNSSLTGVSTSIKVSDFLALAGVDYSEVSNLSYVFKGVSVSSDPSEVYGLSDTLYLYEDSKVNLVFEEVDLSEWTDEHGILLFDIDFEDSRAASVLTANTGNKDYFLKDFAKVNPYMANTDRWAFSTSGMDLIGIENGAVKLQWDGTGKWPQILIGNPTNSLDTVLMGENGTYYVHAEYKVLGSLDSNLTSIAITSNGVVDGTHKGSAGILALGNSFYTSSNQVLVDEWMTIEGGKSTWDNDTDGLDNDDINKITTVFTHSATTNTPGGYYLMDNIKLWWKPAKVDVTIVGGQNADFETVTLEDVSTSSTVDQLIALIPGATSDFGKITGLATEDGVKLSTLDLTSDTTLQALWSPWVIVEGGQEFATDAKGISGGGSGQWTGSYGNTDEVGNGGGQVTGAISWMYSNGWYTSGGNLFNVQDTVAIGENNAGDTTATWATPAVHSITDMIRENINTTLATGNDAEYVLVKYRYDNLPNLAEVYANDPNPDGYKYTLSDDGNSLTYYGRAGTTQYTFEMAPDYFTKMYIQCQDGSYQYGGGQEFHQNELMQEDVWYYDLLPVNATMQTKGVKCVIVQTWNRFDGQITEYDYVRFVKLGDELAPVVPEAPAPEYTPTSSNETSYRLNAPNGIRFKADIDSATNDAASDYGWVVGRAAKGATDETLLIDAVNTITAYGRQDGVDLKRFFEETDDLKTFTAVIYNIPAGNEDDTLCIKPFVIVDGEVFYGEMISKTPRQVADAHGIDVSELMKK